MVFTIALILALVAAGLPAQSTAGVAHTVAIIVGPVGELTDIYRDLADTAADAAERHGAKVRRAYSPDATPERVLAAVEGADIIIYFGHGTGYPNPYAETLNPESANGWGLQGPGAHGTDDDALTDGSLAYFGEAWIARHARPAPGFVMIYSNVCYAPGAGEGHDEPSTPQVAAQRAGYYSRTPLAMGAGAVFATDFYAGAASLLETLLGAPGLPYGEVFSADPRFEPDGLTTLEHPFSAGHELWLHRSAYFEGTVDYWYAFAGDPSASFGAAGSGRLHAPLTYAPERPGMLLAGSHELLRFAPDGVVTERRTLTLSEATATAFSARQRHGAEPTMWLELSEPESGWWLAESPAAYVSGVAAQAPLPTARELQLASGTHAGHRFDASGVAVASATLTLDATERTEVDAEALINGQRHLHVRDGELAGYWLPVSDAVRLGALVPEPIEAPEPGQDTTSSSVTPSPTPSATPRPEAARPSPSPAPSLPPPPPPPAPPAPSSVPSPSPSPSASPTSPASPTATPSPASSATPAPSATPNSASVSPSPSPSASP